MGLVKQWRSPKPLAGVKSRKRAIFDVEGVQLQSDDDLLTATSLTLTLSSRIAAIGKAGHAAATLLDVSSKDASAGIVRNPDLIVLHLSPKSVEATSTAVAAAIEDQCPHVVVVEEAREQGNRAWNQLFRWLLSSDELRTFRGAVIVCADSESWLLAQVCSERWVSYACDVRQEAHVWNVALVMVENVLELQEDHELLEQALSEDTKVDLGKWIDNARTHSWNLSLLGREHQDGLMTFAGLLCYHGDANRGEFNIEYLFVPKSLRGRGYGKRLVQWAVARASERPEHEFDAITLRSPASKVSFYEHLGFADMGQVGEEGGTYSLMELRRQAWSAVL